MSEKEMINIPKDKLTKIVGELSEASMCIDEVVEDLQAKESCQRKHTSN